MWTGESEEIEEGERKRWKKVGRRGERPLVGVNRGQAKEEKHKGQGGTSRGLRRESGKPWSASMEPGVRWGQGAHRCLSWWAVSRHKQGPGTACPGQRPEVRGQSTAVHR
ncbi:unnamed protein product [Rangifer tarandus platyrhynchus]|uniref:Uncharacterized protein n=1 Tax=Rangifer tarandus platyrhynchus TaxID=3082113 RepID=A0ABN8Z4R3_RANTA|nr:unnamed protein product [Rangifer tarandus platyrhynchus]